MKEIDLLPEWYKRRRKRHINYCIQYAVLGCIIAAMLIWDFSTTHSIRNMKRQLVDARLQQAEAESVSQELAELENKVAELKKGSRILEKINTLVSVTSVLAEISFLVDNSTVFSRVTLKAEKISDREENNISESGLRMASDGDKESIEFGKVRFKVVMSGMAANAKNVAELICRLEDSPYFCQVTPLFSRKSDLNVDTKLPGNDHQLSEFEISSYLANYRKVAAGRTEEPQNQKI